MKHGVGQTMSSHEIVGMQIRQTNEQSNLYNDTRHPTVLLGGRGFNWSFGARLVGKCARQMKKRISYASVILAVWVLLLPAWVFWAQSPVKGWKAPLTLPTYEIGPPDQEPMLFLPDRVYQRAWGAIYPYGLYDNFLDVRDNKAYKAINIENKYVKVSVFPELGGRIFSATDKTNGYDYIYRQSEIRPALIGMLGAWISGGMEWNIPHHHRATSYLPVDYRLMNNADGSSTIVVGELELRHRMNWTVAITLYPDKTYMKVTSTLLNGTPFVQSFLDFTNAAVSANKNYQIIFPPDTQVAVFHGKVQFVHWPIAHEVYQHVDYTQGVDLSWWKNSPTLLSYFAWGFDGNFFGGYDHGKEAGTICVQDHNVSPGAKFFEWGNSPQGRLWDKVLDSQGDYLELMAGNFSDNQPDYSWIEPGETKTATQYWFPIRGIGGAKNANLNGAVNLELVGQGKARIGFSATQEFRGARILLAAQGKGIFEQTIDLSPDVPFVREVVLPDGVQESDLKVTVLDSGEKNLLNYQPTKYDPKPMPLPVTPPPAPKEIKTVDELYRAGLRLEQFHSTMHPDAYFKEALRRDPDNYDVNTAMGRIDCERGLWPEAVEKLTTALDRATHNYTQPKDGEAYYYLGVALDGQGKTAKAEDAFYRASWSEAWTAASYFQIAELDSRKGEWEKALTDVEQSLVYAASDTKALDLKAALLRRLGRTDEALQAAQAALVVNALDPWAAHERDLLRAVDQHEFAMGDVLQTTLELALDYTNAGMISEATGILKNTLAAEPDPHKINPLIYYYLGYLSVIGNDAGEASRYFQGAAQMPTEYVFPFRLEEIRILETAMRSNPADTRAPYYLGNLLYNLQQPDAAIHAWEKAAGMDPSFAMVRRNLALAYQQARNDIDRAIATMEVAVALDKSNARFLYELDSLYEAGNVAPAKRLATFETNPSMAAKRSDTLARMANVYLLNDRDSEALEILKTNHFHTWEGEEETRDVYMNACLLQGEKEFRSGRFQDALNYYKASLEYPENLEVAQPYHESRLAQVDYLEGQAYARLGGKARALEFDRQALAQEDEPGLPEMLYYRGLAALELRQRDQAEVLFDKLIVAGEMALAAPESDPPANFGQQRLNDLRLANGHYLVGLGYLGRGDMARARKELDETLRLNASHLGAINKQMAVATKE